MRLNPGWKKAVLVSGIIMSVCAVSSYASQVLLVDAAPPPGFERLNEPQTTAVDVYYGGRYISTEMATYTTKWVKITNPQSVLDKISGVTLPKVIMASLRQPLKTNSDKICYDSGQKNCGIISPKIVGGIFNEAAFRLDLFINPAYLKLNPATAKIFLPPSDGNKSFIQQVNGMVSGSDGPNGSDTDYTVQGSSLFALKENNIQLDYDYSKNNHFSFTNAILEREFQGNLWQTGLLSTSGFGLAFSSDNQMWGVRLASSVNTRLDRGLSEGTPLQIFMPVRGRVDVLRNGRLIYTTFAEAGNRMLDTSGFPSGSYNVLIRIRDVNGRIINTQNRFFARDIELPKTNVPYYFFEMGKVVDTQEDSVMPGTTENWLARAGANYRLGETWAGTIAFAGTQGKHFAELGLFKTGEHYRVSPGFMAGSDRSHGVKLNTRFNWKNIIATADYRRLWNANDAAVTTTTQSDNGVITTTTSVDRFTLLENSFEQAEFSLSVPLFTGVGSYRSTYRRQTGFDSERIQSLEYTKMIYRDPEYSITTHFSYSQSEDDKLVQLSLELGWNDGIFSHGLMTEGNWQKQESTTGDKTVSRDYKLRYDLGWNSGNRLNEDIDTRFTAQKSKSQTYAQGALTAGTEYGAISGTVAQTYTKGTGTTTSYGGSISGSLVTDGKHTSFGGNKLNQSGLMVDIEGVPDSENFNVMVNGKRMGVAKGGENTLVPLSPFASYEIRLEPANAGFFNFREAPRNVTLYPGNVVSLDYRIKSLQLVFGRLLDDSGKPFANAVSTDIKGVNNETDSHGIFQFQLPYGTRGLTFRKDGRSCQITLPVSNKTTAVVRVGNTVCHNL